MFLASATFLLDPPPVQAAARHPLKAPGHRHALISLLTGNGRVLLTLDGGGRWSNLFYPHPGQYQHLREMRLGVFEVSTGRFWWLGDSADFTVQQSYLGDSNTAVTVWSGQGMRITAHDDVHPNHDLIVRLLRVESDTPRQLRLFAYHAMTVAESKYQNTAYWDEQAGALVHYKRDFYFEFFGDPVADAFVCGEHTLKGLLGTYVDAEDGAIAGGRISHGAADSLLQWNLDVQPGQDAVVRVFVAVGRDREAVGRLRQLARTGDITRFEHEANGFWRNWTRRHRAHVRADLGEEAARLYVRSFFVLRNGASAQGGVIASPDVRTLRVGGDTYNFCWWRDGGYIANAMDEAGLYEQAHRFLRFAVRCQSPDGAFLHRHFPDGTVGSTWHPPPFLQIDQVGTIVAAVWHHFKRRGDLDMLLEFWPLVRNAANFMMEFRDPGTGLPAASYDLWEERKGIHTYSAAVVVHALERAARIAEELGKDPSRWRTASQDYREAALRHLWDPAEESFVRSLSPRDAKMDASILLALHLGLVPWDDPRARQVVAAADRHLLRGGGVARYPGDTYYGHENPWLITTLWLALAKLRLGDAERCRELIQWVVDRRTATDLLPEQVDPGDGTPRSAVPLLWSHSTFIEAVNAYRRHRDREGTAA